jgi:hypothetical protein
MWLHRAAAYAGLIAVGWYFDTTHANRWLSSFVLDGGLAFISLGGSWLDRDERGSGTSLMIPYKWRVLLGVMALAWAARQLTVDFFATSALVTWVAIVLLTYRHPGSHARARGRSRADER